MKDRRWFRRIEPAGFGLETVGFAVLDAAGTGPLFAGLGNIVVRVRDTRS